MSHATAAFQCKPAGESEVAPLDPAHAALSCQKTHSQWEESLQEE